MALERKPACRTMWMFPRNIRYIDPWKLTSIAGLLDSAGGCAQDQAAQDECYAELERLGVKRPKQKGAGVENSGGFRTYLAQLACLGLFYLDDQNCYVPTHAGRLVIEGKDPARVLRCQLLRMQYPSVYGWGPNVQISPQMKVKPLAFLVKLLQDRRIGALTQEEVAVAVVYGRRWSDYETCAGKIKKMREIPGKGLRDVIDRLEDICTPRRWKKRDDELWEAGIVDAEQIANTALNYLSAAGLIESGKAWPSGRRVWWLSEDPRIEADVQQWMTEAENIDAVTNNPEYWAAAQNRFGRYDKQKVSVLSKRKAADGFAALLRAAYIAGLQSDPYGFEHASFVKNQASKWQRSEREIEDRLLGLQGRGASIERHTLLQAAISGGKEALILEKGIANLFKKLGFDDARHIGQKKATGRVGGFPDIYIHRQGASECGMADTKATVRYEFPLVDTQKLGSYYKDSWKEISSSTPCRFFLYIAGNFGGADETIQRRLDACRSNFGAPVSAVTVTALLDLLETTSRPSAQALSKAFQAGKLFNSASQIIVNAG